MLITKSAKSAALLLILTVFIVITLVEQVTPKNICTGSSGTMAVQLVKLTGMTEGFPTD